MMHFVAKVTVVNSTRIQIVSSECMVCHTHIPYSSVCVYIPLSCVHNMALLPYSVKFWYGANPSIYVTPTNLPFAKLRLLNEKL